MDVSAGDALPDWSPTVGHRRRPRVVDDPVPSGDLAITSPPEISRGVPQSLLLRLLPAVMVVAVVGMVAMMLVTGGRTALANPLFFMFPLMMVMSMVGMLASGGRGGPPRAAEINEERKDYLRHLAQLREQADEAAAAQRRVAERAHPDPRALAALVGGRRMWERRPADGDFGDVRMGLGAQRLSLDVVPPETAPADTLEPVSAVALRRFVQARSAVADLPVAVSLRGFPAIGVSGPDEEVEALIRAVLLGAALHHGPDHLGVALVADDPAAPAWDWLKWLPHVEHPTRCDGLGPARMLYRSLAGLEADLAADLAERGRFVRSEVSSRLRHLIVVIAGTAVTGDEELASGAGLESVTVVELGRRTESLAVRRGLGLVVGGGRLAAITEAGVEDFASADRLPLAQTEAVARRLARFRPESALLADLDAPVAAVDPGLPSLVGIADAGAFDPTTAWRGRSGAARLRVPIGYASDGHPVELDLKESAHGGMGPHGLCVGATGSGKPHLL